MKRIIILIITVLIMIFTSQAQHIYIHETDEGTCRQSYHSLITSDGCIIIDEDIFDGSYGSIDLGIKFLKINPQEGLVDSLFVDDMNPGLNNMLAKNGNTADENVYLYFSSNNGVNYINVLTFTDDMEIIAKERKPLPIEGDMKRLRYHMENDGDFIASWHDSTNDTCSRHFARFGLDGTLKTLSEPINITGEMPVNNPFFIIENEPLRMGFLTYDDNHQAPYSDCVLYVYVIDENLQLEQVKTIQKMGTFFLDPSINVSVTSMNNGYFAIMSERINENGNNNRYRVIGKYDSNINLVKTHQITFQTGIDYPQPIAYDAENNVIYAIWYDNSQYSSVGSQTHLRCLDADNMTMVWEKVFIKGTDSNIINTIRIMDANTVALSGFMSYKGQSFYDSYAFVSFVDSYDSVDEAFISEKPFLCYPNPAKDVLNISFTDDSECQSVAIYSIDGRLVVETFPETSQSSTINIANLTSGLYLIKVRTNDGKGFTERIVKE